MKPSLFAASAFALATASLGALAWQQYRELIQLRGAALIPNERADLQKRIWDLEKTNQELSDQLLAARSGPEEAELVPAPVAAETPVEAPVRRGPAGGRGQAQRAYRDALAKPEVQAAIALQRQFGIEERYAALFRNLNLSPDQAQRLKMLLAERQSTMQDTMMIAREQGINPRSDPEGFRKLVRETQDQIDASIREVVGESGFSQLQTYDQTLPQRALVGELQQRLSYSDTPLTSTQAEQLVQILANNSPNRDRAAAGSAAMLGLRADINALSGGAVGRGNVPITADALNQAQGVLAQPQVEALRQMREQQRAQQQVQRMIRESMRQARESDGGTPAPRPPPGG